MSELRKSFSQLKDGLSSGQSYTLIYRSKPLAEIKPYKASQKRKAKHSREKKKIQSKVQRIHKLAGGLKLGITKNANDLNKLYDEEVYA